jgi:hypothetical protein
MRPSATDRNLLLGILAVQMGFITREAFIKGMQSWALAKAKPLGQMLIEQGQLSEQRHALMEALVEDYLAQHEGDVTQSLATLSSVSSTRDILDQFADADVTKTFAGLSTARTDHGQGESTEFTIDKTTPSEPRFRILRFHAKGGLGQVSVAFDEELHREVALKEIQSQHAHDPIHRTRFLWPSNSMRKPRTFLDDSSMRFPTQSSINAR